MDLSARIWLRICTISAASAFACWIVKLAGKPSSIDGFDVEFIKGDILDGQILLKVLKDIDVVVHLAADNEVIKSVEYPENNFRVNAKGTLKLLMAMRHTGVNHIVNASTGGAIIGDVEPPVDEQMAPAPVSPYGASKLAAEGYCSAFAGSYAMTTTSLRFSNVYGPQSFHKGSVVARFLKDIRRGKPIVCIWGRNANKGLCL